MTRQDKITTVTFDITNQDVTKSSCVYMSSDTHPDFDAIEAVFVRPISRFCFKDN